MANVQLHSPTLEEIYAAKVVHRELLFTEFHCEEGQMFPNWAPLKTDPLRESMKKLQSLYTWDLLPAEGQSLWRFFLDAWIRLVGEDGSRDNHTEEEYNHFLMGLEQLRGWLENWYTISNQIKVPEPAIQLNGPNEPLFVCGREKGKLIQTQFNVVKVLLEAGPEGLSKDALVAKSSVTDAVNCLKRLHKKDSDWGKAILLPAKAWGGYRILFY